MKEFSEFLFTIKTDPVKSQAMLLGLRSFLYSLQRSNVSFNVREVRNAYEEQEDIGWDNLLLEVALTKWDTAQEKYRLTMRIMRLGRRWLVMILSKLMNIKWDMWNKTCQWRHRKIISENPKWNNV